MQKVKVGDWVVFDLRIGQIKKTENGNEEFSDGVCNTSGRLADRCRPLTLRNKVITETIDYYYEMLRHIDGESGFNYPDISQYFSTLAIVAIDEGEAGEKTAYEKAKYFTAEARKYSPVIDGVRLFRRNLRGS